MLVSDFNYDLPPGLIAQKPLAQRDHSRLLVLERKTGRRADHEFYEIADFLKAGDLLVFNDTRVIPARLFAFKPGPGGARVEVFLLRRRQLLEWECLVRPGRRARPGTMLRFAAGVTGEVLTVSAGGGRIIKFNLADGCDFHDWLLQNGETPLPPYINEKLADPERYQTIYSKYEGSVAAPTAGLHFTGELLERLSLKGVRQGFLTLHVGLGTFRPVQTEVVEEHLMHAECFSLSPVLTRTIAATKKAGGKVIAVGTTVVRVLESQVDSAGVLQPGMGETKIFIYPGYQFKVIDGLITNFHLPKSTLLMLVSAFAGREFVLESYRHAVRQGYRFFSFGDAMLII